MKKHSILFALIIILIFAGPVAADWKSLTTGAGQVFVGQLTAPTNAGGIAYTGACVFYGIVIKTDGTNDVTFSIYANTAASGPKLILEDVVVSGVTRIFTYGLDPGIWCTTGIYVKTAVAGSGSYSWQVLYDY